MSLRCLLGFHKFRVLTKEHGFDLKIGGLDDEFDPAQFLHMTGCDRCGKLHAYISDNYWTDRRATMFHRNATLDEIIRGLVEVDHDFWLEHIKTIKEQYGNTTDQ